jgi:hypothetical protein
MNQMATDQGWRELQMRINALTGRFLKEDVPAIEYKSNVTALLQAPSKFLSNGEIANMQSFSNLDG